MNTAVVLAGGHGLRLWPLTEHMPKPMVPIDDRPILEFVIAGLRASGFRRVLVVLQFNPGSIVSHFGKGERFGVSIDYALQDGELGTAGGVRQAMDLIEEEDFLVISSDILFTGDLLAGMEFHQTRRSTATLALSSVDDPSEFGLVAIARDGRILEFHEKPPPGMACGNVVNAGIYFLSRRALEAVPPGISYDFGRDLFPDLVRRGEAAYGWRLPGYWRDIGTFKGLEAARRDIRENPLLKNVVTRWPAARSGEGGRIWIHKRTPAWEWLEMDMTSIGHAAGIIWKYLSEHGDRPPTIAQVQKLKGLGSNDALAALGWLAREGKLLFKEEGKVTRVQLTPSEVATAR